jgi:Ser/Thr protein kinase RdoA (MazF antagonist)
MKYTRHYVADSGLLTFINKQYAIKGEKIRLYRTSQGRVFFIQAPSGRKVFKLYLPTVTDAAIQTTRVIAYLDGCEYPVVKIIPATDGELYVTVELPEGKCVGVLFEYAEGICIGYLHRWREADKSPIHPLTKLFGKQVGLMHRLMEQYGEPLIQRGRKERIFGDMIAQLSKDNYDEAKVRNLEEYGNELWDVLSKCPAGFYHADMHSGNTKYRGGRFTWMDFDKACVSYPVMDFGWLLETDWVCYHNESRERSRRLFDEVYAGYGMERTLTENEITAALHCVAIIHFEAISLHAKMYGKGVAPRIMDREYEWLMRWRESAQINDKG